jgi:hypothetical protein
MAFQKIGINLTALQNITAPSYSDFNISSNPSEIANQIPEKANLVTNNFLGLGIMVALFLYLVFKLGDLLELKGQPFSTLRSVGISAGIVSIIGFQMIMIGYFTEFYHVIIFVGIFLVSLLWVYLEDKR